MAGPSVPVRITKRVVDQVIPGSKREFVWDSELKGFGLQIEPTGTKTYIVRYRPKGLGRDGAKRFAKIGRHGDLTADEARTKAKSILGQVASGADPAQNQREVRAAHLRSQSALTVEALGEMFLNEHVSAKRKPRTVIDYQILLRKHAFPRIGTIKAEELKRAELSKIHSGMSDMGSTANRMLSVVSSMYGFAAKRDLVPEGFNPARGIELFRTENRERYLSTEEIRRLGDALLEAETVGIPWSITVDNPTSKHVPKIWKGQREVLDRFALAAIRLLLFTGAKLREILDLKWNHVDMQRGLLLLPDSKTGKKTIVLSSAAIAILEQLRPTNATEQKRHVYVIQGQIDGKPRSDLKKPWNAIRRHARLEDVRLHDLRHTFASIGAGSSLGLPIVGKLLGHSQPQTTARYAHLDADPLRRATDLIGDHIVRAMEGTKGRSD